MKIRKLDCWGKERPAQKDVKNEGWFDYLHENTGGRDKMSPAWPAFWDGNARIMPSLGRNRMALRAPVKVKSTLGEAKSRSSLLPDFDLDARLASQEFRRNDYPVGMDLTQRSRT